MKAILLIFALHPPIMGGAFFMKDMQQCYDLTPVLERAAQKQATRKGLPHIEWETMCVPTDHESDNTT